MQASLMTVSGLVLVSCLSLLAFTAADVASDVNKQINDASATINANVAAAAANGQPGTSVSSSCTTDASGNKNCVQNVSSNSATTQPVAIVAVPVNANTNTRNTSPNQGTTCAISSLGLVLLAAVACRFL